jgi:hypothetical protein
MKVHNSLLIDLSVRRWPVNGRQGKRAHVLKYQLRQLGRECLFDSNCFKSAPDSYTGGLNVPTGQQFVDNPEGHDRIRPLTSV